MNDNQVPQQGGGLTPNQQPAPENQPMQQPAPQQPSQQPIANQQTPQQPNQQPVVETKVEGGKQLSPQDKARVLALREQKAQKKSTMTWVILVVISFVVLLAGLGVFLLSQGNAETNPFLKMLGIEALDKNAIILTLSDIAFGIITFLVFIISIVNLFKAGFSKKDPVAQKKSMITATVSGFFVLMLLFGWVSAHFYLAEGVKQNTQNVATAEITTTPEVPLNLTAPVKITFDASSIKVDPRTHKILSYAWNFDDGDSGTGQVTSHTYESKGKGEFEVSLIIKAIDNKTQEVVQQEFKKLISIQNEKVHAEFTVSPEKGDAPLTVKLDASESKDPDGEIVSYEWDLDEDNQYDDATGSEIEYEFKQVGKYTIGLRVTDNNGESAVAEHQVEVENPDKVDSVIEIENLTKDFMQTFENYTFSAEKSGSKFGLITKYEWNFGDGATPEAGKKVSHAFKKAGTFDVVLKIEDSQGNTGTATKTVVIEKVAGGPKAAISTTPQLENKIVSGNVPLTVNFDASDSDDPDNDIVEYSWDFNGDEEVDQSGVKTQFTYDTPGEYAVTVWVKDSKGNQSSETVTVKVFSPGLEAKITADPIDGYVPLRVQFDGSGSSYPEGKIVSYEWDFGDDTAKLIGDAVIQHEYERIGSFIATMTAITSDGKRESQTLTVNVRPVPLQACFKSNNIKGPAPLIVTLDPRCSTGTITEYRWDFGYDNKTSRQRKPTHTFNQPGTYEISLEVRDSNNTISTFSDTIVVTGEVSQ